MTERSVPDTERKEYYGNWMIMHPRFSDMDINGHINNAAILQYFEHARISCYQARTVGDGRGASVAFIVENKVCYLSELSLKDELELGARIVGVGRSSVKLAQAIFVENKCAVTLEVVLVNVDLQSRKSKPFTERDIKLFTALSA